MVSSSRTDRNWYSLAGAACAVSRFSHYNPPICSHAGGIAAAARHAETVQRFITLGIDPVGSSSAEYAAQIKIDIGKYAEAVKISGARAD